MEYEGDGDTESNQCTRNNPIGLVKRIEDLEIRLLSFFVFNGISTFVGYLMPKPFSNNNSSGTI